MIANGLEERVSTAPDPGAQESHLIKLELGDFLHRIPKGSLREDSPHDTTLPITFSRDEMESKVSRGETTIPLSEIYRQAPSIFKGTDSADSSAPVRLPWQKVVKLLGPAKSLPAGVSKTLPPAPAKTDTAVAASSEANGTAAHEAPVQGGVAFSSESSVPEEPRKAASFFTDALAKLAEVAPETPVGSETPLTSEGSDSLQNAAAVAHEATGFANGDVASFAAVSSDVVSVAPATASEDLSNAGSVASELHGDVEPVLRGGEGGEVELDRAAVNGSAASADLEQLQRKIRALEGMQKAAAMDLGREREARLKAERQVNALERSIEEGKGGAATTEGAGAPSQGPAGAGDWGQRAVERLESDIEGYRKRIKTLLSERDSLKSKNEELEAKAAASKSPAPAVTAPNAQGAAPTNPAELQNRISQLKAERAVLEKARSEAIRQLEDIRSGKELVESGVPPAEIQAKLDELEVLRKAHENAVRELEQVRKERDQALELRKQDLENFEKSAGSVGDRAVQGLRRSLDAQSKAVSSLTREKDDLTVERDRLRDEVQQLRESFDSESQQLRAKLEIAEIRNAELQGDKSVEESRLEQLAQERDNLRARATASEKELATLQNQFAQLRKQTDEDALLHDAERRKYEAELAAAHAATEEAVAAAKRETEELVSNLEKQRFGAVEDKSAVESRLRDVEQSRGALESRCKGLESDIEKLRQENAAFDRSVSELKQKHEEEKLALREEAHRALTSAIAEAEKSSNELKILNAATINDLKESHRLAIEQLGREHQTVLSATMSALETAKADAAGASEQGRALLDARTAEHRRAISTLEATHAANIELLKAQHQQQLDSAKLEAAEELSKLRTAKDEEIEDLEASTHHLVTRLEREKVQIVADKNREIADVKAEFERQNALFRAEQEKAMADVLSERNAAVGERDQRIVNITADRERRLAEWVTRFETLQTEHAKSLSAITAERDAAFFQKDQQLAEAFAERDRRVAQLTAEHRQALATLNSNKDAEVARLREEVNTFRLESDRLKGALLDVERRYPAEVARLREDLDASRNESSELTGRLAAAESDSRRRADQLAREREALLNEKVTLLALLEETRETLRNRTEEFSRQLDGLIRQRDEARSNAEAARASSREQAFALERERADLIRGDAEQRDRIERELARLRRERDAAVRQRDAMRERADVLLERQQQLLADLSRSGGSGTGSVDKSRSDWSSSSRLGSSWDSTGFSSDIK